MEEKRNTSVSGEPACSSWFLTPWVLSPTGSLITCMDNQQSSPRKERSTTRPRIWHCGVVVEIIRFSWRQNTLSGRKRKLTGPESSVCTMKLPTGVCTTCSPFSIWTNPGSRLPSPIKRATKALAGRRVRPGLDLRGNAGTGENRHTTVLGGQLGSSLAAAAGNESPTFGRGHARPEANLALTFLVGWLVCTLHGSLSFATHFPAKSASP